MKKKNFFLDYIFLLLIFISGIIFFTFFPPLEKRRVVVAVTALFYILWGSAHSLKTGTFSLKVMAEYTTVALLGGVILWMIMAS